MAREKTKKTKKPKSGSSRAPSPTDDGSDPEDLESQSEGEEDLEPVKNGSSEAVVTSTDWTTETILLLFSRKTIDLDPSFQRRDAWTQSRKSKFIESLMMGLPIPQIVLAEKRDKPRQFIVIDGKQRLLTLQQFSKNELVLTGLTNLATLNGKTYSSLADDPGFRDHLESFRNQPIRSVVVKNWPTENFLYLVFLRLNTGSVPLAPQELRQALHPGPFLDFANKSSASSVGIRECLRIAKPDFRMRDIELLIRFFGFKLRFEDYHGSMKDFLDGTSADLNKRWASEFSEFEIVAEQLEAAIDVSIRVFPSGSLFSLWVNKKYEGRFNRAVFDVFTHYLSDQSVRQRVMGKEGKLRELFQRLCEEKPEFKSSLQVSTKSLASVVARFSVFGNALGKLVGTSLAIPRLDGQKIFFR